MTHYCCICHRKLSPNPYPVTTKDDHWVYVGSECYKLICVAGEAGYQPPTGGPRQGTAHEVIAWMPEEYRNNHAVYPHVLANAAFIVRACNSHDELLEACRAALANVSPMYAGNHHVVELLRKAIETAEGR